ncbi:MAG: T9SS type A sorting domain-containing protein [Chitinophagales bacterium]
MNHSLCKHSQTSNSHHSLKQRGLFLFCLTLVTSLFIQANNNTQQLHVETGENWLKVNALLHGMEGYQGCGESIGELMPAYKFEIYHKKTFISTTNGSHNEETPCTSFARGKWTPFNQQISKTGEIVLSDIPHGQYKVVAYIGEAIGCELTVSTGEYPTQSIVYRKLSSTPVYVGVRPPGYEEIVALKAARAVQRIDNQVQKEELTSISDAAQLAIFPNPSNGNGVLTLELAPTVLTSKNIQVSIFNLQGKQIHQQDLAVSADKSIRHAWQITLSQYLPGTYLIRLTDYNDLHLEQRLVIQ